jgi:hypothetical protein
MASATSATSARFRPVRPPGPQVIENIRPPSRPPR